MDPRDLDRIVLSNIVKTLFSPPSLPYPSTLPVSATSSQKKTRTSVELLRRILTPETTFLFPFLSSSLEPEPDAEPDQDALKDLEGAQEILFLLHCSNWYWRGNGWKLLIRDVREGTNEGHREERRKEEMENLQTVAQNLPTFDDPDAPSPSSSTPRPASRTSFVPDSPDPSNSDTLKPYDETPLSEIDTSPRTYSIAIVWSFGFRIPLVGWGKEWSTERDVELGLEGGAPVVVESGKGKGRVEGKIWLKEVKYEMNGDKWWDLIPFGSHLMGFLIPHLTTFFASHFRNPYTKLLRPKSNALTRRTRRIRTTSTVGAESTEEEVEFDRISETTVASFSAQDEVDPFETSYPKVANVVMKAKKSINESTFLVQKMMSELGEMFAWVRKAVEVVVGVAFRMVGLGKEVAQVQEEEEGGEEDEEEPEKAKERRERSPSRSLSLPGPSVLSSSSNSTSPASSISRKSAKKVGFKDQPRRPLPPPPDAIEDIIPENQDEGENEGKDENEDEGNIDLPPPEKINKNWRNGSPYPTASKPANSSRPQLPPGFMPELTSKVERRRSIDSPTIREEGEVLVGDSPEVARRESLQVEEDRKEGGSTSSSMTLNTNATYGGESEAGQGNGDMSFDAFDPEKIDSYGNRDSNESAGWKNDFELNALGIDQQHERMDSTATITPSSAKDISNSSPQIHPLSPQLVPLASLNGKNDSTNSENVPMYSPSFPKSDSDATPKLMERRTSYGGDEKDETPGEPTSSPMLRQKSSPTLENSIANIGGSPVASAASGWKKRVKPQREAPTPPSTVLGTKVPEAPSDATESVSNNTAIDSSQANANADVLPDGSVETTPRPSRRKKNKRGGGSPVSENNASEGTASPIARGGGGKLRGRGRGGRGRGSASGVSVNEGP